MVIKLCQKLFGAQPKGDEVGKIVDLRYEPGLEAWNMQIQLPDRKVNYLVNRKFVESHKEGDSVLVPTHSRFIENLMIDELLPQPV